MKFEMPSFLKKQDPITTPEASKTEVGPELKAEQNKMVELWEKIKKELGLEKIAEFFKKYSPVIILGGATVLASAWIARHPEDADKQKEIAYGIMSILTGAGIVGTVIGAKFIHDTSETPNKEALE